MRAAMIALALAMTFALTMPAEAGSRFYEVYGVKDGDMLKMRAGPDTGYLEKVDEYLNKALG